MNILVLTNLYPPHALGGYELRCQATVEGLRQRGHRCIVLTSDFVRDGTAIQWQRDVHRKLKPVGFFGNPWVSTPTLFDLEADNCRHLAEIIEEKSIDVIHCWNLGGLGKCLLRQATQLAPLVTDISDHWVIRAQRADPLENRYRRHPLLTRFWSRAQRGLPRYTADIPLGTPYFTSAALRELTHDAGYDVADAPVVHCGVDYQRFYAPAVSSQSITRFGYVGRLHPDKGVDTACAAIATSSQPLHLDIWGEGSEVVEHELRQRWGNHPRIHFHGHFSPMRHRTYTAGFSALFSPVSGPSHLP